MIRIVQEGNEQSTVRTVQGTKSPGTASSQLNTVSRDLTGYDAELTGNPM